jgi:hypothetical protein
MEKTDSREKEREKQRESSDLSENGQRRSRQREIVNVASL